MFVLKQEIDQLMIDSSESMNLKNSYNANNRQINTEVIAVAIRNQSKDKPRNIISNNKRKIKSILADNHNTYHTDGMNHNNVNEDNNNLADADDIAMIENDNKLVKNYNSNNSIDTNQNLETNPIKLKKNNNNEQSNDLNIDNNKRKVE